MFEFRVAELKRHDVFTADNGETWWQVTDTKKDGRSVDVRCTCVQSHDEGDYEVGHDDWFLFPSNDKVIVR